MMEPELFRECFQYSSLSEMYNNLYKTIDSEKNKAQVNVIRDKLANVITGDSTSFKYRLSFF